MPTSLILFDIDRTLFNTQKWFSELFMKAAERELHVPEAQVRMFAETYRKTLAKPTDFDPDAFCQQLSEFLNEDLSAITTVFYGPVAFQESVYEDVVPALEALQQGYTLGIFSEGVETWQERKLALTNLGQYFSTDHQYIFRRKTEAANLARLPECLVIDDNSEVIQTLSQQAQIQPVWLNRDQQAGNAVTAITSLSELPDLVARL